MNGSSALIEVVAAVPGGKGEWEVTCSLVGPQLQEIGWGDARGPCVQGEMEVNGMHRRCVERA